MFGLTWFDYLLLGFSDLFSFIGGALSGALAVIIPVILGAAALIGLALWLNSRKHKVLCSILVLLAVIVFGIVLILMCP